MHGLDKTTAPRRLKMLLLACMILVVLGYTISAYLTSSMIIEFDGGLWWRSTPQGSLFPIPYGSGILTALSQVSDTDAFIYRYLLRIPLLIVLNVLVISLTWLRIMKRQ
jgi:hypothetical protein